jgi:hypothetical protein
MDVQFAIMTLGGGELGQLSDVEQMFLADGGDTRFAYDFKPARLMAAAGGAKAFQDTEGNSVAAPLRGWVIDAVKTRSYWPEKDGNKVPFCSSVGAVFGMVNVGYTAGDLAGANGAAIPHPAMTALDRGDELAAQYDCGTCPMSQFGSEYQGGGGSGGQACKLKNLFLFLPEGWAQPCLLSVPTMSLKNWNQYCSGLVQTLRRQFYTVKTEITIEKMESRNGKPYGALKFNSLGPITDLAMAEAILTLRKELREYLYSRDVALAEEDGVVDIGGRVVDPNTGEVLELQR